MPCLVGVENSAEVIMEYTASSRFNYPQCINQRREDPAEIKYRVTVIKEAITQSISP